MARGSPISRYTRCPTRHARISCLFVDAVLESIVGESCLDELPKFRLYSDKMWYSVAASIYDESTNEQCCLR